MTTKEIATPTFRRDRSGYGWRVFGAADRIHVGEVMVKLRDGSTKPVLIESVGQPFKYHGVKCRYGYLAPPQRSSSTRKPCNRCGYPGALTDYGEMLRDELGECPHCHADFDAIG